MACREVCPIKIDIPRMLLDLRKKTAESPDPSVRSASVIERASAQLFARVMCGPRLLRLAVRFGQVLQKVERVIPFFSLMTKDGKWIRNAPLPPLSRWTRARDLPGLPTKTFHELWEKGLSRDDS